MMNRPCTVRLVLVTLPPACIVHCILRPMYTKSTVTLHPKRTCKWTDCSSTAKLLISSTKKWMNHHAFVTYCPKRILYPLFFSHFVQAIKASQETCISSSVAFSLRIFGPFCQSTSMSNSSLIPETSDPSLSQTFKKKKKG
jgi:hypothetical protein